MLVIACLGLAVNLFVIWKLHPHMGEDLNVRSAFLHAFGDAAASLAVVCGGILVLLTGKHIIDPIAAILVDWLAFGHRLELLQWIGVAAILLAAAGMQQGWGSATRKAVTS